MEQQRAADLPKLPVKPVKSKECSLYGLFIADKTLVQQPDFDKSQDKRNRFKIFILSLLGEESLHESYQFKTVVTGYTPSPHIYGKLQKKWPLI